MERYYAHVTKSMIYIIFMQKNYDIHFGQPFEAIILFLCDLINIMFRGLHLSPARMLKYIFQ